MCNQTHRNLSYSDDSGTLKVVSWKIVSVCHSALGGQSVL